MTILKIGSRGRFVETHAGKGNKHQWWYKNDLPPIYEYLGLFGRGANTKHMFRSVAGGYLTTVNPLDFELGDLVFKEVQADGA